VSLIVGATINYFLLAPLAIGWGHVLPKSGSDGIVVYGFRQITQWSLWRAWR